MATPAEIEQFRVWANEHWRLTAGDRVMRHLIWLDVYDLVQYVVRQPESLVVSPLATQSPD